MDRISPNFVYAFILIISRLGLLPVIVTELWPLIAVRILFLLNVFRFSCFNIFRTLPFYTLQRGYSQII